VNIMDPATRLNRMPERTATAVFRLASVLLEYKREDALAEPYILECGAFATLTAI
jgi:hypothetical protein